MPHCQVRAANRTPRHRQNTKTSSKHAFHKHTAENPSNPPTINPFPPRKSAPTTIGTTNPKVAKTNTADPFRMPKPTPTKANPSGTIINIKFPNEN
jgi:hypothetical protein